jgi:hypothetical protein
MDPIRESALSVVRELERELLVRGFIAALNDQQFGASAQLEGFLHPDVTYRPSPTRAARGRDEVLRICEEVHQAFAVFFVRIDTLIVGDEVTLTEHTSRVGLAGGPAHDLMGFSSFRFEGNLIIEWHQIHA